MQTKNNTKKVNKNKTRDNHLDPEAIKKSLNSLYVSIKVHIQQSTTSSLSLSPLIEEKQFIRVHSTPPDIPVTGFPQSWLSWITVTV